MVARSTVLFLLLKETVDTYTLLLMFGLGIKHTEPDRLSTGNRRVPQLVQNNVLFKILSWSVWSVVVLSMSLVANTSTCAVEMTV